MESSTELLLELLSDFVYGRKSRQVDVNNELFHYSKKHQLDAILYYQTKNQGFRECFCKTISAYTQRKNLLDSIIKEFQHSGLNYYIVKGNAVAQYYSVPALRSMVDTDIVVKSQDKERAADIIEKLGFTSERYHKDLDCEWHFYKSGIAFELHDKLLYESALNNDAEKKFSEKAWEYVSNNDLDKDYHFVFLLIHLKKHLLNSGAGFRQFLDIAFEIKNAELDFDQIKKYLAKIDLIKFAGVCFALCDRWFGIDVPFREELSDSFYEEATRAITENGVFGVDDSIGDKNKVIKIGKMRTIVEIIFPSYDSFRFTDKYKWVNGKPWLLPIAWIYRNIGLFSSQNLQYKLKKTQTIIGLDSKYIIEKRNEWGI